MTKPFLIAAGLLFLAIACAGYYNLGMTVQVGFLFAWSLVVLVYGLLKKNKPVMPPSQSWTEVRADPDAAIYNDEDKTSIEITDASAWKEITTLPEEVHGYYNVVSLNMPLKVVDDFFTGTGLKRYNRVFVDISGYLYRYKNAIAWDGLIVRYDDEMIVTQMFWSYHGDEERVSKLMKQFPVQYPLLWVDWNDGSIDCLNSTAITGVENWKREEET